MNTKKSDIGSIYVLSNSAMPGLLKIGFTQNPDTKSRVYELSKSTAVPLPFVLEFEQLVENPAQYERLIHARLAQYRISPDREFFRADNETVERVIRKVVFGAEDLDVKKEIEHFVDIYRKHPESFTNDNGLIGEIEAVLKGS